MSPIKSDSSPLPTKLSEREIYCSTKFTVAEQTFELTSGDIVERVTIKHPGAVVVLPIDELGRAVLIRQFRYPLEHLLLECCAGTREPGEETLLSAKRELAEELGLNASEWIELGEFFSAPGFCNEILTVFLARNLTQCATNPDRGEVFAGTERFSSTELEQLLQNNKLQDAKTIGAITLARVKGHLR